MHGERVLQAGPHRDEGLRALAGRGPRDAPARVRPARAHPRHRLPEQLRPALDRRHRHRGQEDRRSTARWSTRTTSASAARVGRARRAWRGPSAIGSPADEVPAAIERLLRALSRRPRAGRDLPRLLRAPHRRGAARDPRRRARGRRGARCPGRTGRRTESRADGTLSDRPRAGAAAVPRGRRRSGGRAQGGRACSPPTPTSPS